MIDYVTVKHAHMGFVALSGSLFAVRAAWRLRSPARLNVRWVRIAPHVVDTLLLASGATLAVLIGTIPGWLGAKLAALPVYIVLGAIALTRGRTERIRAIALVGAVAAFAYMVSVALTKSPMGPLAFLR